MLDDVRSEEIGRDHRLSIHEKLSEDERVRVEVGRNHADVGLVHDLGQLIGL